ncbi:MAG: hypothetical protein BGP03_00785 [Pseudonocardia sp. 73-21]|nr:MAG: hypothetical protein BGP03_00785 [Pseudonocardia sp. 73-21]
MTRAAASSPAVPFPRSDPIRQRSPFRQRLHEQVDEGERRQVGRVAPARVERVVAGAQLAARHGAAVVGDGERAPLHPADELAGPHCETGLLVHLPHQCLGVGLARLDASTGHGPEAPTRVVAPPDEQDPPVGVVGETPHTGDAVATFGHRS